jgi:D-alanine-D-alanine ligase
MSAMDREKYDVVPIGITKDGHWISQGDPLRALEAGDASMSQPAALLADPSRRGLLQLEERKGSCEFATTAEIDVVFPVLHGTYGEDGTVQGLLELAGVAYVGAGVTGSALGIDKAVFKDVMRAHGMPLVAYLVVKRLEWDQNPVSVVNRIEAALSYPVFVKPANLGSSVGISKCHSREELAEGLVTAARYDRKLVVEAAVPAAREIEVSVLGNDHPTASIPGEVVPSREFYSYEAKYIDQGENASTLLIPAPLPDELTERVRDLAVRVYKAIDCSGMARADFLLSDLTSDLYVNELNTIPGFTAISMYPKLWEASGVSYSELIDRLIELAIERHEDKLRSETSFEPGV